MQLSVYLLVTLLIRASEIACAVTRSLPDQLDAYQGVVSESRKTWVSYVRDRVIENIWPVRAPSSINRYDRSQSSRSNPPAKLLARYGSDVVLRFKIQSSQEAEALASAVEVLFLDVWESSADWVDIRLSKDVVRCAPYPLVYSLVLMAVMIGAILAWPTSFLSADGSHSFNA